MKKYNLEYLTWFDFEALARDVVEKRESVTLEGFGVGRDFGIDFRRIYDHDRSLIVQAKHYRELKELLKALKKEVPKVKKLKPSRYILVVSLDMLPAQKRAVQTMFSPYILNPIDIICRGDIEQVIDSDESILKKNHKLWFTSAAVLRLILQSKILGRSNQLESEIKNKARLYVETDNVNAALDVLEANNYVIVSGATGIGKTTLVSPSPNNGHVVSFEMTV